VTTEAQAAIARAISDLCGPVFESTSPQEWNELVAQDRIVYGEDGRAVGVKES
jgi:hypothetical protein